MALSARVTVPLFRALLARKMTTTPVFRGVLKPEIHPGYAKNKALCEHYQLDNGVPIHLKGGPMDKVLYYTTLILCAVGVAQCLSFFYSMSFPKKPDEASDSC